MSAGTMADGGVRAEAADTPFTLADLMAVIRRRRGKILRTAILVIIIAGAALMAIPTMWTASAVVMVDQQKNTVADATAVLTTVPTDAASMQNQLQLIISRDLAGMVVDREHLTEDAEFNPALDANPYAPVLALLNPANWTMPSKPAGTTGTLRDQVIDAVLAHLTADAVGLSTTISVKFQSRNASDAARIANAFAKAYVDRQLQLKTEASRKAIDWLTARTGQLAQEVEAEQTQVERYKAAHGLTSATDGVSLNSVQLGAINTQLVQARADLAAKEATYGRVKALIASGHVSEVSQIVASPLIVQLRTQESQLIQQEADLATRYGPLHPKLAAVHSQRADLTRKIAEEVERIAGSLANDVAVAKAQADSLRDSLRSMQVAVSTQDVASVELNALQTEVGSTRATYDAFVKRLRQLQDQEPIQAADAQVISTAPVPLTPSSPHRTILLAASVPAGLLMGLLAALIAERASPPVPAQTAWARRAPAAPARSPQPARAAATPPPAVLATLLGASISGIDDLLDRPSTPFSQGISALLADVQRPARGLPPRVIAVAADMPGENKSAVAIALARAAALSGLRTVLIDADLAHAPAARALGLPHNWPGIGDILTRRVPLSRAFWRDPRSPLLVLASAVRMRDPAAALASAQMAKLICHLRDVSDLLVIDVPALARGNEAVSVLPAANAVLFVADPAEATPQKSSAAAAYLGQHSAAPLGLVLAV